MRSCKEKLTHVSSFSKASLLIKYVGLVGDMGGTDTVFGLMQNYS